MEFTLNPVCFVILETTLNESESSKMEYDGCNLLLCKSIDDDNAYDYKFFIDGISLVIVSVFGIIGIIMSLIVLLKPKMREEKISRFLTALCVFDCIFLFLAIFYIGFPNISGISCR